MLTELIRLTRRVVGAGFQVRVRPFRVSMRLSDLTGEASRSRPRDNPGTAELCVQLRNPDLNAKFVSASGVAMHH